MQALVDSVNLDTAEASGVCGPDLAWYYRGGILVITGNGPMNSYDPLDGDAPWDDLREDISLIYISEGVTSVGDTAFESFWMLSRVVLPESLESIASYAFSDCRNLPEMTIPAGVKSVGDHALSGTTITFLGDAPAPIDEEEFSSAALNIFDNGATVHYSGTGFEPYMQYYQDMPVYSSITWVKD